MSPRPRDRILTNLETIYRDAYARAKELGDEARHEIEALLGSHAADDAEDGHIGLVLPLAELEQGRAGLGLARHVRNHHRRLCKLLRPVA